MTTQVEPDRLVIAVQTRRELDAALDGALDLLKPAAVAERVGILVTQLAPGRYEARLNAGLPPGRYEARLNAGLPPGTIWESWGASSDEPK